MSSGEAGYGKAYRNSRISTTDRTVLLPVPIEVIPALIEALEEARISCVRAGLLGPGPRR